MIEQEKSLNFSRTLKVFYCPVTNLLRLWRIRRVS